MKRRSRIKRFFRRKKLLRGAGAATRPVWPANHDNDLIVVVIPISKKAILRSNPPDAADIIAEEARKLAWRAAYDRSRHGPRQGSYVSLQTSAN